MSTRLYTEYVLGDDGPHGDINRKCWAGNPWIIEAYTGRCGEDRDFEMRHWLNETFGEESWPFGEVALYRRWFRGGATIHGWTWFGFDTEATMSEFAARWPNPEPNATASEKQDEESKA